MSKSTRSALEHPHAEVLRALADGKEIQMLPQFSDHQGGWIDYKPGYMFENPIFVNEGCSWRVKPIPKPDIIKYLRISTALSMMLIQEISHFDPDLDSNIAIKIIFDGETMQLKSVEIAQ